MTASSTWFQRIADAVLTTDPVQRLRLSQAGLAMLLMAVSVGVMHYVVWSGDAHAGLVNWWTLFALGGLAIFFLAIRSGATLRMSDPSLTLPQIVYAIATGAAAYALAGPMRGGVFPVLGLTLMFGMFQLRPAVVAWISVYAVGLFGAVMALMAWRIPEIYRPDVEFAHFLIVAATAPVVSVLAGRLSRMRERLRRQKLDLARALARIQELATRDELTGLINRRHMLELLEQERQRSVRSGRTFCVALIDIDGFKAANDRAGHGAGDELLRVFARESLNVIRLADVLARWGGDEFVLLLTDTAAPLARAGLERLRQRAAGLVVNVNGVELRITVSAGLTEHIAGETVPQALDRADRALRDAKAQGRDRVFTA
jgi:diguanylate cyclase (GGDEF)-like protein